MKQAAPQLRFGRPDIERGKVDLTGFLRLESVKLSAVETVENCEVQTQVGIDHGSLRGLACRPLCDQRVLVDQP